MGLRTAIYKPHPQDETNTDLNIHKQIHIKSKDRPSQYTPQSKTKNIYICLNGIDTILCTTMEYFDYKKFDTNI